MRAALPAAGTAPLWFHNPGTGQTHAQQYAHFRSPNDVYSDKVYNRPAGRAAPPMFTGPHNAAAGKPGEKGGHVTIMPCPRDSPAYIRDQVGQKQTRWPAARSAPFLYGKSKNFMSGSL